MGPRAREEFLAEAQEILEQAGVDLAALEELLSQRRRDPSRVNALFRSVHTLKGLAGTFGLDGLTRLAHALEDALDRLRLDRDPFEASTLDRVSRALDLLGALLDHVRAGVADDGARTAKLVRELHGNESRTAEPLAAPVDPSVLAVLTEYEEHRLRAGLAAGGSLWRVRMSSPLDAIDRALEGLRDDASRCGEVITFIPGGLTADGVSLELDVLLVSTVDGPDVRDTLAREGRAIERVSSAAPSVTAPVEIEPADHASRAQRSVRVDIGRLDELMSLLGDFSLMRAGLQRASDRARAGDARGLHGELTRLTREFGRNLDALQRGLLEARMVPLGQVFERVASEVRKLSRKMSRTLRLVVTGADTAVDKLIVEELGAPLMHLVRNAIDHGIEAPEVRAARSKPSEGTLAINAWQAGSRVVIEIEDDGAGVEPSAIVARAVTLGMLPDVTARSLDTRAAFELLFRPGFTTRDAATEMSGRGVGLDVVRASLARLGGVVELVSEPGVYTRVTITVPITLAVLSVLLVSVRGRSYALPMSAVSEALRLRRDSVHRLDGREVITQHGRTLPLCRLDALFGHASDDDTRVRESFFAVVIALGGQRAAIAVDALIEQQDVVVKALGPSLRHVRWFSGAADLGDQRAGLVLDAVALLDEAMGRRAHEATA